MKNTVNIPNLLILLRDSKSNNPKYGPSSLYRYAMQAQENKYKIEKTFIDLALEHTNITNLKDKESMLVFFASASLLNAAEERNSRSDDIKYSVIDVVEQLISTPICGISAINQPDTKVAKYDHLIGASIEMSNSGQTMQYEASFHIESKGLTSIMREHLKLEGRYIYVHNKRRRYTAEYWLLWALVCSSSCNG